MTAKLSPEQMTNDLVLKRSRSDEILPQKDVSPPFLENIGASSLLVLDIVTPYPESLIVLGVSSLIALSPAGRKRWRVWLAAGIVFVIVGLIADATRLIEQSPYQYQEREYGSMGIASLVFVGIIVASIVFSVLRNKRRPQREHV